MSACCEGDDPACPHCTGEDVRCECGAELVAHDCPIGLVRMDTDDMMPCEEMR